jgi:dolichol-phosphate mannosyltransferase
MQLQDETLWIVMPAYNEEASVGQVLEEWLPVLRSLKVRFVFAVLNDGSTDRTLEILYEQENRNPEIKIFNKPNTGHGRSCIYGYQEALKSGADWVLQIDSDGQCDAKYFPRFWTGRKNHNVLMGFRYYRKDGWLRLLVSRIVTVVVFVAGGVWVWDPNVPYRLVAAGALQRTLQPNPNDFDLSNVLISARLRRSNKIKWIPIVFRQRYGGSSSVKTSLPIKQGLQLFRQFLRERKSQTGNRLC